MLGFSQIITLKLHLIYANLIICAQKTIKMNENISYVIVHMILPAIRCNEYM